MARDYGKIYTRIWGDPDFRVLGRDAQHLYMQLVSQPDLSMAGVLTVAPTRWAQQARITEDDVMDAMATLTENRFAYIDTATQEVLLRSYVRRDEGWKSPTTMKAIYSAMNAVLSPGLRSVLADEVRRIDTAVLSEKINEKTGRSTKEVVVHFIDAFLASVIPHAIPLPIPHRIPHPNDDSDTPSDTPSDGSCSRANEPTTEHEHEPAHEPANAPTPTMSSPATPSRERDRFDEFWDAYPRKVGKDDARGAWKAAKHRADQQAIIDGCIRLAADPNLPEKQFIPHPGTWLRQGRWDDEPLPPRRDGPRPVRPTTDQRVSDALQLAARLAAQEAESERKEITA